MRATHHDRGLVFSENLKIEKSFIFYSKRLSMIYYHCGAGQSTVPRKKKKGVIILNLSDLSPPPPTSTLLSFFLLLSGSEIQKKKRNETNKL